MIWAPFLICFACSVMLAPPYTATTFQALDISEYSCNSLVICIQSSLVGERITPCVVRLSIIDFLKEGKAKSGGFARPGLCECHQVGLSFQQNGDGFLLNFGRGFKSKVGNSLQEGRFKPQGFKFCHNPVSVTFRKYASAGWVSATPLTICTTPYVSAA